MTDEIYRPPISLEQERREVEMMAGTPDNPGDGFASREAAAFVDNMLTAYGFGRTDQRIVNNLRAFNIIQNQSNPQVQVENMGYVFFTRPSLNLSYDNIIMDRTLTPMLSKEPLSIGRYVRAMLDPLGNWECPLVDATNVFMPLLSNTVESLAGWQDPIIDTYQSTAGL